MKKGIAVMLLCASSLIGLTAQAAEEVGMHLRGTLRAPPPCSLNDDGVIEVDFGQRLGINKVDGINYRQAVNYRLRCDAPGALPWELKLSFKGIAASFDRAALQTDNGNLGIRLYQDDKAFAPNTSINIDPANPPRLEAVPVTKAGVPLKEGAFAATATLQADYL
ncbi:TPA: fimbrial protein [Serratia marcescens]|nr:fimbrial protein [Serratia marcescens]